MGISLKLLLAGLSGFLVTLSWSAHPEIDVSIDSALVYGLCGSLFAAGVLLPYLKREDLHSWRPVGLVIVSAASFYCAVYASSEWGSGKWGPTNLQDFVIASLIGAGIVLLASPPILALRYSLKYIALGVLAALIGGVSFRLILDEFEYGLYLSFGIWHMLMCIALHLSNPSIAEGRWLASVKRSKFF